MKVFSTLCLSFLCLGLAAGAYAQDSPQGLSFEEAYQLALKHSERVQMQEYSRVMAEAQRDEAKYFWTPKLSLKVHFAPMPAVSDIAGTENDIWSNLGEAWGVVLRNSLEFWMPIFTSTKRSTTEKLAQLGVDIETIRERAARLDLRFELAQAYYGLQFAQAAGDVLSEAESHLERVEREYRSLMEEGSEQVKGTDQYRIELARAKVLLLKQQLQAAQNLSQLAFSLLTQLPATTQIQKMPFEPPRYRLPSFEDLLEEAKLRRSDYLLIDKAKEAAALEAQLTWLNWWPELLLVGEAFYRYSNAVPPYQRQNFYIKDSYNGYGFGLALMLRWELDPVRQHFKVNAADAKAARHLAQLSLADKALAIEIRKDYEAYVNAYHKLDIVYQARRSAKRFLTQEFLNYENDGGKVDDLMSALQNYIEQRSLYLQSIHEFQLATVRLQKSLGLEQIERLVSQED